MNMKPKHSGLTLIGIYLSFFFNVFFIILGFYFFMGGVYSLIVNADFSSITTDDYGREYFIISATYLIIGFLIILWGFYNIFFLNNFTRFKNSSYILLGLITLIPSLIIGGLFILIDGNRSIQSALVNSSNIQNNSPLEIKLKEIENLFQRRIITKDEYDLKRKDIISSY